MGTPPDCTIVATADRPGALSCLVALAEGHIARLTDMCPACRTPVLAAIDGVHGSPLDWHETYRRSA